jgi:3-oxoacyl-[acyl-carrier protein] reductase
MVKKREVMTKIALVSGATGGLGQSIAMRLSEAGYSLALHYYQNRDKAIELLDRLSNNTGRNGIFQADLSKEEEVIRLCSEVKNTLGPVEVLINNAGIPFSGLSWKQTVEDWQTVFSINTMAAWLLSKHSIPMMRDQGNGRIVYTSSVVAHRPLAGTSAYAASKAALEGLTRAQAVELARFGITVNCIAPGYFDAGMISSVNEEIRNDLIENTPAKRLGSSRELAEAVVYLCSEQAAFTTGQILHVNGGLYI